MNSKLLTLPLVKIVEDLSIEKPHIKRVFSKVRALLKNFANSRSLKLSELRLLDVYGHDNNLHKNLMSFIARLPQPEGRKNPNTA